MTGTSVEATAPMARPSSPPSLPEEPLERGYHGLQDLIAPRLFGNKHTDVQPDMEQGSPTRGSWRRDAGVVPSTAADGTGNTESSEEDENLAVMDPDNPLMKRVQDAWTKQLTEADERLTLELREKDVALKRAKDRREEVGVELYALQQQLMKVQEQLEQSHQRYSQAKEGREQAETLALQSRSEYDVQKGQIGQHRAGLEGRKAELASLSRQLLQVQLFHDDLKAKFATTRRVTLKAEEDLLKQEAEKRRQDFQLHGLTQRLERLQDQRATLEYQITSQKRELHQFHATIQDAQAEMEAIVFEKRQLFHQWKSSVIGMERRQEVLGGITDAIRKQSEALLVMDNEIIGFKRALAKLAAENETLALLQEKLSGESTGLGTQIEQLNERRDALKQQFVVLQKSLDGSEGDLKQVTHQRQSLTNALVGLRKQVSRLQGKYSHIGKEMAEQIQTQLGIEKGMQGTARDAKKLAQIIYEKENEVATAENGIALVKLEGSRISEGIRQLKQELQTLDTTIADKNGTILRYDQELRRGNDEMVKKQSEIDLLNKKLSQIMSQAVDEALGPLEATIHSLTKSIATKEKECWDLQQFWLRNQNELVGMARRSNELAEAISTLHLRHTILNRKKVMLNQGFDTEETEIKEHQRQIKTLQNEMVKINTLVSKQSSLQSDLEKNNLGLEQEFRYRLKEAELEAVRLEQSVQRLKDEKDQALDDLLDIERQIMLWEKKIQLAKETREALDPNVGAQEIKEMTSEIHRMELRLVNLEKVQEKLATDMEKSVMRRETIVTRSRLRGKGYTQATLNKAIADLAKRLKACLSDLRELDRDTERLAGSLEGMRHQVHETQQFVEQLQQRQRTLLGEVQVKMDAKTALFTEMSMLQKKGKRYQAVQEGKYQCVTAQVELREAEVLRHVERMDRIEKLAHTLVAEYVNELGSGVQSLEVYLSSARRFITAT